MQKKQKYGFTLLEIIAVISLILLVSTMAIPMYNNIVDEQRRKVDTATALQLMQTAKTYYILEKDKDDYSPNKLTKYITKVYGEIPKSKFRKGDTFSVTLTGEGDVNVSLEPSGISLIEKNKVVEKKSSPATD